jgi:mannose-6-phosphate isomerase-like protein (cupin superfamily)
MNPVSKHNCLKHYTWGNNCDGWNFVDEASLSIKLERMPAHTAEVKHYHKHAQQFFFILKGEAHFDVDGESIVLSAGEGLNIEAGKYHCIANQSETDLEFLLCSNPSTINDRYNIE